MRFTLLKGEKMSKKLLKESIESTKYKNHIFLIVVLCVSDVYFPTRGGGKMDPNKQLGITDMNGAKAITKRYFLSLCPLPINKNKHT